MFVAYSIIIYRLAGPVQFSMRYLTKILSDENTIYLVLAVAWYSCGVGSVDREETFDLFFGKTILFPYFTFAFFHSIEYLRAEIIPIVLPNAQGIQSKILSIKRSIQSRALKYTALHEFYVIPIVLLFHIGGLGKMGIFTPIIYIRLLALRYTINAGFRKTVDQQVEFWNSRIVDNPEVNPNVKTAYVGFVKVVTTISGAFNNVNVAPAPAGRDN